MSCSENGNEIALVQLSCSSNSNMIYCRSGEHEQRECSMLAVADSLFTRVVADSLLCSVVADTLSRLNSGGLAFE